jgi:hypothetical protein
MLLGKERQRISLAVYQSWRKALPYLEAQPVTFLNYSCVLLIR